MSAAESIEVPVNIPGISCRVLVGRGLLAQAGTLCAEAGLRGKCALISDDNVAKLHGTAVLDSLRAAGFDAVLLAVPAGEKSKSLGVPKICSSAWQRPDSIAGLLSSRWAEAL